MYSEGLMDLMEMIMVLPFTQDVKPKLDNIQSKAKERYLPVFEKVHTCLVLISYLYNFGKRPVDGYISFLITINYILCIFDKHLRR